MKNALLAMDLLMRATEYSMKLQRALQQAQAEGRDITDAELNELRDRNTARIHDLLEG